MTKRILLRCIKAMRYGALTVVATLLAAAMVWIAANQVRRSFVETSSIESLAPRTGRWVPSADMGLFIQEWGPAEGPVLMLTHGTGAWSGTWFGTPVALAAAGWRVVAVDLPPFGFSKTQPGADYSRSSQARRLLALIKQISTGPVILVGHSFGAGAALEAAMMDGSQVRQLVLVDPALGLGPQGEMPSCSPATLASRLLAVRSLRTAMVASVVTVPQFSAHFLQQFVHRRDVVVPEKVVAYQKPFAREHFGAYLGDWAVAFANVGCEPALSVSGVELARWAASRPSIALIWGEQDGVTPIAQGEALRRLTGAEMVRLPGVGHIPHLEDPDSFHRALLRVLRPAP